VSEFGRYYIPGPTEVLPEVLQAQARPMIGHRGDGMRRLMQRLQPGLRALFRTERPVYLCGSSATGLMEAAVRNGARRRVLSLVNGAFSDRFAVIADAVGLEVERVEVPWGGVNQPDALERALRGGDFDAVTVVHSETSTGVLNPVRELARVAHEHGCAILVDAVTSLSGSAVETDAWGLDFVLTGSQKALALPPGLALGVAQPSLLERARESTRRGFYFDLLDFEKNLESDQTPSTPPLSLLYALEHQLGRIEAEGLEARWARHRRMAEMVWAWVAERADEGIPLEVVAPEGYRADTVTCVRMPHARGASELVSRLRDRGYTLAPGYGGEKDRQFRIGHMGDIQPEHVAALLDQIADALREMRS